MIRDAAASGRTATSRCAAFGVDLQIFDIRLLKIRPGPQDFSMRSMFRQVAPSPHDSADRAGRKPLYFGGPASRTTRRVGIIRGVDQGGG